MYFQYGDQELNYLKSKDKRLAAVIDRLGIIRRTVDPDLFSAVVHHIIAQQISTKAQQTIWNRINQTYGQITPAIICQADINTLRSFGISARKAIYLKDFAQKIIDGTFNPDVLKHMTDAEAIAALSGLKGIGTWTAEMILLFCLQRPDIFSFTDLAILNGLKKLYHHRKIDRHLFNKYRRRFSPYGSIASFYLWAIANDS